ncbi:nitrous oxide reductase family maturation protein NosD [Imtechella halotolerans]|uniref:NosD n=1 Tax=Imtechella halotolerans K1 TaxID=946077 RepID=I0WKB8_9FLAO|nr:nitrous oxide reductase family maturation protein NosD [Imtechella halotolerans]EID76834.1 NosD [Imtechella halotolerans K1]WMQ62600.1 nitrous oxide reductase family maturation protein NosD [Imtechella halotolerans]
MRLIIVLWSVWLYTVASYGNTINVCNSCSYKTLKSAIAAAKDGDTIVVKKGLYKEGNIILDKQIVLLGEDNPVLDGEMRAEILTVTASNVVIQGFQFKNVGESFTKDFAAIRLVKSHNSRIMNNNFENVFYGIFLEKSNHVTISTNFITGNAVLEYKSGNGIHLWYCKNITIENNTVSKVRDGIYFEFVDDSRVINNRSFNNLRYGLHFMFSNNDLYMHNTFDANGAGVAVMYSKKIEMKYNTFKRNWGAASYGLLLKEINDAEIAHNKFLQNTIGINVEGSNRLNYSYNSFEENGWAVKINGACFNNDFRKNNFLNNTFDVAYSGHLNDNSFSQNYWSAYTGYDLNRNGIGDVPYRPVKLFSYVVNKTPESIVLLRSLFVDIINFSEKVSPVFTPTHLMDTEPLMKKVSL